MIFIKSATHSANGSDRRSLVMIIACPHTPSGLLAHVLSTMLFNGKKTTTIQKPFVVAVEQGGIDETARCLHELQY